MAGYQSCDSDSDFELDPSVQYRYGPVTWIQFPDNDCKVVRGVQGADGKYCRREGVLSVCRCRFRGLVIVAVTSRVGFSRFLIFKVTFKVLIARVRATCTPPPSAAFTVRGAGLLHTNGLQKVTGTGRAQTHAMQRVQQLRFPRSLSLLPGVSLILDGALAAGREVLRHVRGHGARVPRGHRGVPAARAE